MVPLSTLISHIRTRHEAESGVASPVRWSDTAIARSVNDGLETLAEATGFYERYCTVPVEADRIWYDLRGFTPETVSRIRSIFSSVRNDWLRPASPEDIDIDWEKATGDPQLFLTHGIYWFSVYPHSTTTTGFLRVHFTGIPSRRTHTQEVLGDLPDQYAPALEDYALYEMAALDGQPKRALLHWSSYQAREKALASFIDRRLVGSTAGQLGRLSGRL